MGLSINKTLGRWLCHFVTSAVNRLRRAPTLQTLIIKFTEHASLTENCRSCAILAAICLGITIGGQAAGSPISLIRKFEGGGCGAAHHLKAGQGDEPMRCTGDAKQNVLKGRLYDV
jgi:hypothetical protein